MARELFHLISKLHPFIIMSRYVTISSTPFPFGAVLAATRIVFASDLNYFKFSILYHKKKMLQ
ncbi:MAG: hypothetical protein R2741_14635 [Methanolobus sp.]